MADELDDMVASSAKRVIAAEAREILGSKAYDAAREELQKRYLTEFASLSPADPTYEMQCVRAQIAVNMIADIHNQLGLLTDGQRFEDAQVKRTVRGGR